MGSNTLTRARAGLGLPPPPPPPYPPPTQDNTQPGRMGETGSSHGKQGLGRVTGLQSGHLCCTNGLQTTEWALAVLVDY